MLWVDLDDYFGPDRRRSGWLRILNDRRRVNRAGPPPPLRTALRRFRLHVLDAKSDNATDFIDCATALAQFAEQQGESEASEALKRFAAIAMRGRETGRDVRPDLYYALDEAETAIRANAEPPAL